MWWAAGDHPGAALGPVAHQALPSQLERSLPHRPKTYAGLRHRRDAGSVVAHLHSQQFVRDLEAHRAAACPGVVHDIGNRLLGDPVGSHLDRRRQRGKVLGQVQVHVELLRVGPVQVRLQSA